MFSKSRLFQSFKQEYNKKPIHADLNGSERTCAVSFQNSLRTALELFDERA